jgi:hypothetical protein
VNRFEDATRAAWQKLDVELAPGLYHFVAQAPRTPMRFRRAAVMRGHETDLEGGLGAGPVTLTVHEKPRPGVAPRPADDLPHFDVDADGNILPRTT